VVTKTETRERAGEGNGQRENDATREQIREDQERFGRRQDQYQQQAQEQADEVKRQLQRANETGREAVGQYVLALTRSYQALLPQAVIDPRRTIDFAADFVVQAAELHRSLLQELISAGQANTRAAVRVTEDLSDKR
jgi:hypothetical protein